MHETQRGHGGSRLGVPLRGVAVLATAALVAAAFASSAWGSDEGRSPALEEAAVAASVPPDSVTDSPSESVAARRAESSDPELPAVQKSPGKNAEIESSQPVPEHAATLVSRPDPAAETPVAESPLQADEAVEQSLRAWYHVARPQYRGIEVVSRATHVGGQDRIERPAVADVEPPTPIESREELRGCASVSDRCAQFCARVSRYNVSWKCGCIGTCISIAPARLARTKLIAWLPRYHHTPARYHGLAVEKGPLAPATPEADQAEPSSTAPVEGNLSVRATVVAPTHATVVPTIRRPQSVDLATAVATPPSQTSTPIRDGLTGRPQSRPDRPEAAAIRPLSLATASNAVDDWLFRSLLVLLGLALTVFAAIASQAGGAGHAMTVLCSRVGSTGLTRTRITLGESDITQEPDRSGSISYRE